MLTTCKLALIASLAAIALVSGGIVAPGNMLVRETLGAGVALADDDDDDGGGNRGSGSSGRSGSYGAGAG
ncbi:hypothetical protein [Sinorhizobium medicae]|nr:hypothetical protein [Sinorhizobium medicae]